MELSSEKSVPDDSSFKKRKLNGETVHEEEEGPPLKKKSKIANSDVEPSHGSTEVDDPSKQKVAHATNDKTSPPDVSPVATSQGDLTSSAPKDHPQQLQQHKVQIGNLSYRAHPFTVRVSNLSSETEDMDLVDTFRPKCGAIVHAKIMREKPLPHQRHSHGKSKGWGLVQFEERDAVERALELSDVVGIREQLIKVDRSHMPAVGLVPPGMHRVNPKGAGKSSKRNQRRKEQRQQEQNQKSRDEEGGGMKSTKTQDDSSNQKEQEQHAAALS